MSKLEEAWTRKEIDSAEKAREFLQKEISAILKLADKDLFEGDSIPHVVMVSGVNGVGKTTTIGKLALMLKKRGKSVMLAAGDTFRAAAVDQLQTWADRSGVSFIRGQENGDPASVCFDAIGSAKAKLKQKQYTNIINLLRLNFITPPRVLLKFKLINY